MSVSISFLAGQSFTIYDLAGSGLGFYGPGNFGASVAVGAYQDNTYITDATGAINGPLVNNIKYVHPNSGDLGGGNVHALRDVPNYLASLQIKLSSDTPVKTQNAQVRIFDRNDINQPPVGCLVKVAQLIHPWNTQQPTGPLGSGDTQWWTPGGSGGTINGYTWDPPVSLAPSPGTSGWSPNGSATTDTVHNWYLCLSASPTSIGSKTNVGLYFSTEYL